jgi:hypothetical protein
VWLTIDVPIDLMYACVTLKSCDGLISEVKLKIQISENPDGDGCYT